jgi:hypothetical protein
MGLRVGAVVLGSIGGLVPLLLATGLFQRGLDASTLSADDRGFREAVVSAVNGLPGAEGFGYVAIAVAALLVGADKLLGFSTTWMRFMQTHLRMQKAITIFQYEWAMEVAKYSDQRPDDIVYELLIGHLKRLVETIETAVEEETKTWVDEFNSRLAQLAKTYERSAEQLRPGTISASVTNAEQADGDIELRVNGRSVGTITTAGRQMPSMPPGTHTVEALGTVDGAPCADSASVAVVAGSIAPAQLTLKPGSARARPTGGIEVAVTNAQEIEGELLLTVDNKPPVSIEAGKRRIGKLAPGEHRVQLSGKIGGADVDAVRSVTVRPGETERLALELR